MSLSSEFNAKISERIRRIPSMDAEFVMEVIEYVLTAQISTGKRTFLHEFDRAWELFKKDHNLIP